MFTALAISLGIFHALLATLAVIVCKKTSQRASETKPKDEANPWNNNSTNVNSADAVSRPCNDRSGLLPDDPDLKSGHFERNAKPPSAYVAENSKNEANAEGKEPVVSMTVGTNPPGASDGKDDVKTKPTQIG